MKYSTRYHQPLLYAILACLVLLSAFAFVPALAQDSPFSEMNEDQIAVFFSVDNFDAVPYDLVPGQPVHLSWTVTNAAYVEMWRRDVDGTMTRLSTGKSGDGPDYPPGNTGTIMYELRMTNDPGQGWGSNFRYVQFIAQPQVTPTPQPTPEPTPEPVCNHFAYVPFDPHSSAHNLFLPAISGGSSRTCQIGHELPRPEVVIARVPGPQNPDGTYPIVMGGQIGEDFQVESGPGGITETTFLEHVPIQRTQGVYPVITCTDTMTDHPICSQPAAQAALAAQVSLQAATVSTGGTMSVRPIPELLPGPDGMNPNALLRAMLDYTDMVSKFGNTFEVPCMFPVQNIMETAMMAPRIAPYPNEFGVACLNTAAFKVTGWAMSGIGRPGWTIQWLWVDGQPNMKFPEIEAEHIKRSAAFVAFMHASPWGNLNFIAWQDVFRKDAYAFAEVQARVRSMATNNYNWSTVSKPLDIPDINFPNEDVMREMGWGAAAGTAGVGTYWYVSQFGQALAARAASGFIVLPKEAVCFLDTNFDGWEDVDECAYILQGGRPQ